MNQADIDLQSIVKVYRIGTKEVPVLNNINLKIYKGEMVAIMGASGSGKSTLMNMIGLLDQPTSGKYFLQGKDVTTCTSTELSQLRNQLIGFVFQSFYLLPRLTVIENVELPLHYRKFREDEVALRAEKILEKLSMKNYSSYKPSQLSGGQQQRVAIARALITNPLMILADEPTGSLDSNMGGKIMDLFVQLNQHEKVTIVIITHDERVANRCKRILHIQDGELLSG